MTEVLAKCGRSVSVVLCTVAAQHIDNTAYVRESRTRILKSNALTTTPLPPQGHHRTCLQHFISYVFILADFQ